MARSEHKQRLMDECREALIDLQSFVVAHSLAWEKLARDEVKPFKEAFVPPRRNALVTTLQRHMATACENIKYMPVSDLKAFAKLHARCHAANSRLIAFIQEEQTSKQNPPTPEADKSSPAS